MIYRVGDNDHPSYDYSRQKPTQVSGDSEKFSLDHQKEESLSAPKEEKGEDKKLHEKTKGASLREKSGVKLELSGPGSKYAAKQAKEATSSLSDHASGSALWDSVKDTLRKLVQYAKDLFDKIWNDPPPVVESADVSPEEAERYTEEYYALKGRENVTTPDKPTRLVNDAERDREIQKYLRSGNLEQVLSLLTDNGNRTIAKNSTLLTYYDKSGRLAPVDASDSERILHGDRHTHKL